MIKTEVDGKEDNERGNLRNVRAKRRRDKDLLGIVMQLFLTFRDLAVRGRIPHRAECLCFSASVLASRPSPLSRHTR